MSDQQPFFHELALDNFAQACTFTRLRTLVRAECVYLGQAPLVVQYSLHLMRQFRDAVRSNTFDVAAFSALGANLYYRVRCSMTLCSLSLAIQQLGDAQGRESVLLSEWVETLLEQAMVRCGWTEEHQAQLSASKEAIARRTLVDFMQQLADCYRGVSHERLARTTVAMLELLREHQAGGGDISSITTEQVRRVLEANGES
jgi:hypothetical protein